MGEDIVEIGRDLLAVKASLPHGSFLPWIEAEFGMGHSTADRFMQVAKVYGSKLPTLGNLPLSALYELAAPKTPVEVREEVERLLAAGEIVTKAMVDALRRRADHAETEASSHADRIKELEARDRDKLSIEVDTVLRVRGRAQICRCPRGWMSKATDVRRRL